MIDADLYQEIILDHNRNPRNFREIKGSIQKEGYNPLCGDHVYVYLKIKNDMIEDISFSGEGCAICKASSSMMTEYLKGKTVPKAKTIFKEFHEMLLSKNEGKNLGKLKILAGVSKYPARVKCASLAWHTLKAALEDVAGIVKTE